MADRLSYLLEQMHGEDEQQRDQAIGELKAVSQDELLPFLTVKLADPDQEVRYRAINALAFVDIDRARPLLLSMLRDPDLDIRVHACGCLHEVGNEQSVGPLIVALEGDPEPESAVPRHTLLEELVVRRPSRPCSACWELMLRSTARAIRPARVRPRPWMTFWVRMRPAFGCPNRFAD